MQRSPFFFLTGFPVYSGVRVPRPCQSIIQSGDCLYCVSRAGAKRCFFRTKAPGRASAVLSHDYNNPKCRCCQLKNTFSRMKTRRDIFAVRRRQAESPSVSPDRALAITEESPASGLENAEMSRYITLADSSPSSSMSPSRLVSAKITSG